MQSYTLETLIPAARQDVYDIFADRENNGDFLPLSTKLTKPGESERQGVGAVHFLGLGPIGVREQITELVPGERIAYRVVGGAPVKSHTGTVEFSDSPGGTTVKYTMTSEPSLPTPGFAVRLALKLLVGQFVSGARRELAKRDA